MLAIDCLAVPYSSAEIVIPLGIAVALGLCAFYLWFFIEALSWPRSTWEAAGVSRARWVARLFFLGAIGAVLYLRGPRRELRAAYRRIRWGS